METLTPRQIVQELDKHIIGQDAAKRAVAIALRNRWRRMQVAEPLRGDITPKNILMIGPTGVGKTEIARRLAHLVNAPFIKVEATKFTEIGYVGRDVESIIRDLVDIAVKQTREVEMQKVHQKAIAAAEEKILQVLVPQPRSEHKKIEAESATKDEDNNGRDGSDGAKTSSEPTTQETHEADPSQTRVPGAKARAAFQKKLRDGKLEDTEIEIEVTAGSSMNVEIMAPPGMEEMTSQLQNMFQSLSGERRKTKRLKISEARKLLTNEAALKLINEDEIKSAALEMVQQNGIVFIDEIDKVARNSEHGRGSADVSREGVQRDLLPLVEGSTVNTKYGMVKTDHILFIASGAFHLTKPSDLIPELQGRLPIRVELKALSVKDFERIITEPDSSLTKQYIALLATEGMHIEFDKSGIRRLAEIAWHVNEHTENIGARRLHTVMERLLEDISFDASEHSGKRITIDTALVNERLANLAKDEDLSHFIL